MTSGISRSDTLAHVMSQCDENHQGVMLSYVWFRPFQSQCVCSQQISNFMIFNTFVRIYNHLLSPLIQHSILDLFMWPQQLTTSFASTLIYLNPELIKLKAFGTDGEPELIKAFHLTSNSSAEHKPSSLNIKDKLNSLGVLQSIFCWYIQCAEGKQFEAGLMLTLKLHSCIWTSETSLEQPGKKLHIPLLWSSVLFLVLEVQSFRY